MEEKLREILADTLGKTGYTFLASRVTDEPKFGAVMMEAMRRAVNFERLRCASIVAADAADYLTRADRLSEAGSSLETVRMHEQAGAALEACALNLVTPPT